MFSSFQLDYSFYTIDLFHYMCLCTAQWSLQVTCFESSSLGVNPYRCCLGDKGSLFGHRVRFRVQITCTVFTIIDKCLVGRVASVSPSASAHERNIIIVIAYSFSCVNLHILKFLFKKICTYIKYLNIIFF